MITSPIELDGLAELNQFPVLFVDQFGVLHDGISPYPSVLATLKTLRDSGRRVIVLSNSGRPGSHNEARLARLGISRDLYESVVTSGDTALAMVRSGSAPVRAGSRCFVVSSAGDAELVGLLGLVAETDAARADLVLIAGSQGDRLSEYDYIAQLTPAARRGVPAICVNPDRVMLTPGGTAFGAGHIAELYEGSGGSVLWIGKPYLAIYAHAARLAEVPAESVLCVGDSVEHDLVGARRFGASAALVRTGIHSDESSSTLSALFQAHGVSPDYLLKSFVW
jgi:HAD superfamily hydrolase (TIGR01459 family)